MPRNQGPQGVNSYENDGLIAKKAKQVRDLAIEFISIMGGDGGNTVFAALDFMLDLVDFTLSTFTPIGYDKHKQVKMEQKKPIPEKMKDQLLDAAKDAKKEVEDAKPKTPEQEAQKKNVLDSLNDFEQALEQDRLDRGQQAQHTENVADQAREQFGRRDEPQPQPQPVADHPVTQHANLPEGMGVIPEASEAEEDDIQQPANNNNQANPDPTVPVNANPTVPVNANPQAAPQAPVNPAAPVRTNDEKLADKLVEAVFVAGKMKCKTPEEKAKFEKGLADYKAHKWAETVIKSDVFKKLKNDMTVSNTAIENVLNEDGLNFANRVHDAYVHHQNDPVNAQPGQPEAQAELQNNKAVKKFDDMTFNILGQ